MYLSVDFDHLKKWRILLYWESINHFFSCSQKKIHKLLVLTNVRKEGKFLSTTVLNGNQYIPTSPYSFLKENLSQESEKPKSLQETAFCKRIPCVTTLLRCLPCFYKETFHSWIWPHLPKCSPSCKYRCIYTFICLDIIKDKNIHVHTYIQAVIKNKKEIQKIFMEIPTAKEKS